MRSGGYALTLLAVPLHADVLRALEEEPLSLTDLRRAVGSPPPTTMRGHLQRLTATGILERRRGASFPGAVTYQLGQAGLELIPVARVLEQWLRESPEGPADLGGRAAKGMIRALAEGWSSGIVRALAAKPFSLTELSSIITNLSYPSLERRLGAMRLAGQIEPCPGAGRGTPYAVTRWLRQAVAPLEAASRWERRLGRKDLPATTKVDVEASFLLSLPLVELPGEDEGLCRIAVQNRNGDGGSILAGAMAQIQEGRTIACVSRLAGTADAWAVGSAAAWFQAMIDGDRGELEIGGDTHLARNLVDGLHAALFPASEPPLATRSAVALP